MLPSPVNAVRTRSEDERAATVAADVRRRESEAAFEDISNELNQVVTEMSSLQASSDASDISLSHEQVLSIASSRSQVDSPGLRRELILTLRGAQSGWL